MNYTLYSRHRDESILSLFQPGSAFTRAHIQQMFFANQIDGKRKAQLRLQKLAERGQLKRHQYLSYLPAIYFTKKPKKLLHALTIADVFTALYLQKPQWVSFDFQWEYPIMQSKIIADALITVYFQPDKKGKRSFFLESERYPEKRFNKDKKYESIYAADWLKEPWAVIEGHDAFFPTILLLTPKPFEVKSKLKFIVTTPEEINLDIYSVLRR